MPANTKRRKTTNTVITFDVSMEKGGLTIWASELASAIGRHKYRPKEETFRQVWLRSDKQSFCLAHSLLFKKEIIAIVAASNEAENLQPLPDVESDDNKAQFVHLMKQIILNKSLRKVFFRVMNFVKERLFENEREKQIFAASKELKQQVALETKVLCQDEHKTVATAVRELCERAGEDKKEVIAAVESKLTKDRGTHLESRAIQDFGRAKGIGMEIPEVEETYYKSMEYNGLTWRICGRADAEIDDCIVEVKNRRSRFMYPIPDYDYLQLQTYLFLRGKPRGILLERLRGKNKETAFKFDELSWKEEITPELAIFVSEVCSCIDDYNQDLYGIESSPCSSPTPKRRRPDINTDSAKERGGGCLVTSPVPVPDGEAEKENVETEKIDLVFQQKNVDSQIHQQL